MPPATTAKRPTTLSIPPETQAKLADLCDDMGGEIGPAKTSHVMAWLIEQEHARRHPEKAAKKA